MKKLYTLVSAALLTVSAFAQDFTATTYIGAFEPAPAAAWTDNWTNWDCQNTVYPATTITVNADITSNTTWATGTVVFLQNKVYVTNNAVLTIEPGVIVRGDKSTEATLIISRGSQINAQGTATNPIVFTSNFAAGSRAPGDWGGLILLGNASNNQPGGTAVIEGGLDTLKAKYGGANDADNSGILSYTRIEFAGFPFQPDKEINGLTLGSVGSATTVNHVQVSFSNDDSFEFFGGTVNCYYMIAYRGVDDNFDTDNGYSGHCQFLLGVRDPSIADQCTCSTSEGFESDNNAGGTTVLPQTKAIFSNVTDIGPYRGSTANSIDAKFRRAIRIRRNSSISIFNSVFTDWPTGLHIDGSASESNAAANSLVFKNNVFAGMGTDLQVNTGSTFDIATFFSSNSNASFASAGAISLTDPYNFTAADFRPQASSSLISGADFTHPLLGALSVNELSNITYSALAPNPTNSNFSLTISLRNTSSIQVELLDIMGKRIKSLMNTTSIIAGSHNFNFDKQNLSSGIYFLRINTSETSKTLKLILTE